MRRRLARICVFLLLGAIVNVAVAWGFGFSQHFSLGLADRPLSPEEIKPLWVQHGCPGFGSHVSGVVATHLMTTQKFMGERLTLVPMDDGVFCLGPGKAYDTSLRNVESGLPCRSLTHTNKWDMQAWARFMNSSPPKPPTSVEWLLQSTLIWPGFAINTVFYALVLWLLFAGPFVVRGWRRMRRGLCPKCAYDLRGCGSPNCPECGMYLAPSPRPSPSPMR